MLRYHHLCRLALGFLKRTKRKLSASVGQPAIQTRPWFETIVRSRYPAIDIPVISYSEFFLKKIESYGEKEALVDGVTGKTYTYRQLRSYIKRVGSALTKQGFKKGDVLAIYSPNCPEYAIALFSAIAVGGIVTTVNPMYNIDELLHQLEDSNAQFIVTSPAFSEKALQAAYRAATIKAVIVFGEVEGCIPFKELTRDDGKAFPLNVHITPKEDLVALVYSSGTTGLPKGVMLTHFNLVANLEQWYHDQILKLNEDDVLVGLLPFFHIYGLSVVLCGGLTRGSKIITMPRFDQERFLQVVEKYRPTYLHTVPPIILFMAKHPMVENIDFSSVRHVICGAAPLGKDIEGQCTERLKLDSIRQGYGMTEVGPVTHLCPVESYGKSGSIGIPILNTECKVVEPETGAAQGLLFDGELCVRGPQVMKGYLNNPQATAATIDNEGWLHTGDIGHFDEDGFFFIVDRLKELIKYKGYQVPPAELEAVLLSHPSVQDAGVIGIPDPSAGELPKAFVVRKNDQLSEKELMDFVTRRVAPHKKLRGGIEFLDEIPKAASGKILRKILRTMSNTKQ